MKKIITVVLLIIAVLAISIFLVIRSIPNAKITSQGLQIELSQTQLQQKMQEKLPYSAKYSVLRANLTQLNLELIDGSDRVNLNFDVNVQVKLGIKQINLNGTAAVSTAVKYNSTTAQIFLDQPQIEQISISDVPEKYNLVINRVMNFVVEQYFSSRPIYRFKTGAWKSLIAKLALKNIKIKNQQLVIILGF